MDLKSIGTKVPLGKEASFSRWLKPTAVEKLYAKAYRPLRIPVTDYRIPSFLNFVISLITRVSGKFFQAAPVSGHFGRPYRGAVLLSVYRQIPVEE